MKPTAPTMVRGRVHLQKLSTATASCSEVAAAYGKCINANFYEVSKDMCQREFGLFKECVQNAMKKRW